MPKGAHAASLSLSSRLPCDFGLAVVCLSRWFDSTPASPLLIVFGPLLRISPACLPLLCVCVCDLKTWDLGSSVCVCVCVCTRSWDLPFFKVLIGHSVFNDAAGDETETSWGLCSGSPDLDASYATRCRGGSFEFRTSALSPGLLRGLIRMPGC